MKAVDIVLPPPENELEDWKRRMNCVKTQLRMLTYYKKRKIEVKDD